jgi:ubiquinone/menaquinone biosynthesis C-methylase UbiE
MNLYQRYVLPKLVHLVCGTKPTRRQREKVVPLASGDVLEIGLGSGLNLPFYDAARVRKVWGLEPSPEMRKLAAPATHNLPFPFEFLEDAGEEVSLDANSVDTVLVTYTLCTIPDPEAALREMARVLRPSGRVVFCEHGLAPDASVRRWQDRLNPIWRKLGGGCNLNRPIPTIITSAGFEISTLDTMYIPGFRPASFNYWGTAVPQR